MTVLHQLRLQSTVPQYRSRHKIDQNPLSAINEPTNAITNTSLFDLTKCTLKVYANYFYLDYRCKFH